MRPIYAQALVEATAVPQRVLVIVKQLDDKVPYSSFMSEFEKVEYNNRRFTLKLVNGSEISIVRFGPDVLRGYRPDTVFIEGKRGDYPEEFINGSLLPWQGVVSRPSILKALSEELDIPIRPLTFSNSYYFID